MWLVEINIPGRRFTREVHFRRAAFPATPRSVQTRLTQLIRALPRAAA